MKLDVSVVLKRMDGKNFQEPVDAEEPDKGMRDLKIKNVIAQSLLFQGEKDKVSLIKAMEDRKLAQRVYDSEKEVELTLDEVAKIRTALGDSFWNKQIKGLCGELLEEAAGEAKPKLVDKLKEN